MINIAYNTTTHHIVLVAKTATDKKELSKITASMTSQSRFFEETITNSAVTVRIPILSENLISEIAALQ